MIVFVALGTRGDVQPLCCIAEHLRRQKLQQVAIITHAAHEAWLTSPPFQHLKLYVSSTPPHCADERSFSDVEFLLCSLPYHPALVVFNLFALETYHISEAKGYRCVAASPYSPPYPCPSSFESSFIGAYGPELHSRLVEGEGGQSLSWSELISWFWPLLSERWDRLRVDLSLPPLLDTNGSLPPSTALILGQPELLHPRPGFWPSNLHTTGFWLPPLSWFTEDDRRVNDNMLLEASMTEKSFVGIDVASSGYLGLILDPMHFLRVVEKTLVDSKVSGLILTSGWKPMEDAFYSLVASREISMLRLQCKPINHVLLFSSGRVQALIHPGGSGTVASALSWGIPQVLFPLHHDQWRSSERLIDLGLSSSIDSRLLVGGNGEHWQKGSEALTAALNQARSSEVIEACLRSKEELKDGLDEAARILLSKITDLVSHESCDAEISS